MFGQWWGIATVTGCLLVLVAMIIAEVVHLIGPRQRLALLFALGLVIGGLFVWYGVGLGLL